VILYPNLRSPGKGGFADLYTGAKQGRARNDQNWQLAEQLKALQYRLTTNKMRKIEQMKGNRPETLNGRPA